MSTRLNPGDEERAVLMLDCWSCPLKWNAFLETFAKATGKSVTRQAVHKSHPVIVEAFKEAKARLRKSGAADPTATKATAPCNGGTSRSNSRSHESNRLNRRTET